MKHLELVPLFQSSSTMAFFKSVTVVEVTKLVTSMTNKSCELDPMPTSFVKVAVGTLAPIITRIVNGSLMSGVFSSLPATRRRWLPLC